MEKLKNQLKNLDALIETAINEDVGTGDVTSEAVIPEQLKGAAKIIAKENGIICGIPMLFKVYKKIDPKIKINILKNDGDKVSKGDIVAEISGRLRAILTGERLALNFLQRLSGTATETSRMAEILAPFGAKIFDTRKTNPAWRALDKYAVRTGGGSNHRFGLFDMYLIKDNHVDVAGGVKTAIELVKKSNKRKLKIVCETRNMNEVREAAESGVDVIMLDNMKPSEVKKAMGIIAGRAEVEISGGITKANIQKYAGAGVKRFSSGFMTHSAKSLDLSMLIKPE